MNDYQHPNLDRNLMGIQNSMEYNAAGLPALRVIGNNFGWGIQLADGDIDGVSHIEKFGMNLDVDSDKETIWDGGGIYTYIETAETLTVTSDSIEDVPSGSGARSVEIQGTNQAGEVVVETVNVGATTIGEFKRVFRVKVRSAGASGVNEGTISITSDDTSTVLAIIGVDGTGSHAAGRGQTFMAQYTIPAGKTGYITQWTVGAGKQNTDAIAMLMTRDPNAPGDGAWNARDIITVSATTYAKNYNIPIKVNAGDDIEVRAYSSTNNSLVSSTFCVILIDNPVEE
ncbi:hypothetical protein N9I00_01530 [bacterium]|nr:hypothetical protein [bacterium]